MLPTQLSRIKDKLALAKESDPDFKQFGSDYHQYKLNDPLTASEVAAFEATYRIQLPRDFVSFITTLGNGGPGHFGGAGPYYGIYKLGELGYMTGCKSTMHLPCRIHSELTANEWRDFTAFAKGVSIANGGIEFDRKYDLLFSGLLPIGTRGDSYQAMLILNGNDRSRVVNIDQDLSKPIIAAQKNFLDWYEQWLDELINTIGTPNQEL